MQGPNDRRTFLVAAWAFALTLAGAGRARARQPGDHPEPRPGIDGTNVLSAEELSANPDVIPLFDGIREIPHIADGIRCQCGCAEQAGMRSLLSCFEDHAMAMWCEVCQSEGRMVVRLHRAGRDLDQIRRAVDARFG